MKQQSRTADVCTRFSLLIKALVSDREAVSVISGTGAGDVPLIRIYVGPADRHRILGQNARVARSLRVLLDSIGEQQGIRYRLEIDDVCFELGPQRALRRKPVTADPWLAGSPIPAY